MIAKWTWNKGLPSMLLQYHIGIHVIEADVTAAS